MTLVQQQGKESNFSERRTTGHWRWSNLGYKLINKGGIEWRTVLDCDDWQKRKNFVEQVY